MDKTGDADDCISTPEAVELAKSLSEKEIENLPLPGQVDFINGGPPCQVCEAPGLFSSDIKLGNSMGNFMLHNCCVIVGIFWNEQI